MYVCISIGTIRQFENSRNARSCDFHTGAFVEIRRRWWCRGLGAGGRGGGGGECGGGGGGRRGGGGGGG